MLSRALLLMTEICRWRVVALMLLTTAGLLLPVAALRAQGPAPQLEVLGDGPLEVEAAEGETTAEGFITLLNSGSDVVPISVALQAASETRVGTSSLGVTRLPPQEATRVGVTFDGLDGGLEEPLSGQLVITGDALPIAKEVTITPAPQPEAAWPEIFIGSSLGIALALMLIVAGTIPRGQLGRLKDKAVGPKWSFDSWATILTAVGALLTTVVAEVTLPEIPEEISKDDLVALSLAFAAMLVIGPFAFYATRPASEPASDQESGFAGFNVMLLFACCLTCGAVIGQLATLTLLVWELVGGGLWGIATIVVAAALALLALRYTYVTGKELATKDWKTTARELAAVSSRQPRRAGAAVGDEPPAAPVGRPSFL